MQSNHARATAVGGRALGLALRPRRQRHAAGEPDRQRAARPAARRRGPLRCLARGARAGDGRGGRASSAREGRRPFVIPLGASTPLGAAAYALAVDGAARRRSPRPTSSSTSTSSGGTQAGLIAGCRLHGLETRVIGISADDPAQALAAEIRRILVGLEELLGCARGERWRRADRDRRHASSATATACRRRSRREAIELVRATRSAVPRSDLHGEGDGRADRRVRARRAQRAGDGPLLAHRRTSGSVRVTRRKR